MCGIFGWSFKDQDVTPEKMVIAAVLTAEMENRGDESWGIYDPIQDVLAKGAGRPSFCMPARMLAEHQLLLAHTRKATTGKIRAKNAHPFRFEIIVGAHNGMVSNHDQLNKAYRRKFQVDSMHLFKHYEEGLELGEVKAYGAVEFAEPKRNSIYLAKFNGGDLAAYEIKDMGLIWASTNDACIMALKLAGLEGEAYQVMEGKLYEAKGGLLYNTGNKFEPDEYHSYGFSGWRSNGYSNFGWGDSRDRSSQTSASRNGNSSVHWGDERDDVSDPDDYWAFSDNLTPQQQEAIIDMIDRGEITEEELRYYSTKGIDIRNVHL